MAVKKSQEPTKYDVKQATIRAALQLDAEADVYRAPEEAGLSAQQWQAIALLVAGKRGVDVAEELGCAAETVSRWRSNPLFAAAYNATLRDIRTSHMADLRSLAGDALKVIRERLLYSEDDRVCLSACVTVIRLMLQVEPDVQQLPTTPADIARQIQRKDFEDAFSFG